MEPAFWFLLGLIIGCAMWAFNRWTYRSILLQCAAQGTAECLDGGFYYIVPEKDYADMQGAVYRVQMGKEVEAGMKGMLHIDPDWVRRHANDPEPEGCAHCGAIAGCCAEYPDCPGGKGRPKKSADGTPEGGAGCT